MLRSLPHHQHHPGHQLCPPVYAEEPEGDIDQDLRQRAKQRDGGILPHQRPNGRIRAQQGGERTAEDEARCSHQAGHSQAGPDCRVIESLAPLLLLASDAQV